MYLTHLSFLSPWNRYCHPPFTDEETEAHSHTARTCRTWIWTQVVNFRVNAQDHYAPQAKVTSRQLPIWVLSWNAFPESPPALGPCETPTLLPEKHPGIIIHRGRDSALRSGIKQVPWDLHKAIKAGECLQADSSQLLNQRRKVPEIHLRMKRGDSDRFHYSEKCPSPS